MPNLLTRPVLMAKDGTVEVNVDGDLNLLATVFTCGYKTGFAPAAADPGHVFTSR